MARLRVNTGGTVLAKKEKTRIWVAVLRILGCLVTPPLVAYAVITMDSNPNIRSVYFEEFAGFNRALIARHLPKAAHTGRAEGSNAPDGRSTQAWRGIHPRFLELTEQDQIGRIESLLAQERNGLPVPALFDLRRTTKFPATGMLEVHRLDQDKWLAMIAGTSIAVFLIVQCCISLLAISFRRSRKKPPQDPENMIASMDGMSRYEDARAYERRY